MYFRTCKKILVLILALLSTTAFSNATIGQAFLLFEKHDYLGAAQLFYDLKLTELSDAARDEAEMGLATALSKAGLSLSALHAHEAIVSKGASHRFFAPALIGLIDSANDVGGEVLIAQLLDKTYSQNLDALGKIDPKSLQHLHFMLSKRAFRAGRADESVEFAHTLQDNHEAFARAQYVVAVVKVSDQKAVRDAAFYEQVIKLFDSAARGSKELQELSQLAKARVYYERGMNENSTPAKQKQLLEKSIQLYRSIPISSSLTQKALFEKAWAHTALKQADFALGALYALGHPRFESALDPDADVLAAINYLSLCDYEHANEAVKRIQTRYAPGNLQLATAVNSDRQTALFKKLVDQLHVELTRVNKSDIKDTKIGVELTAYLTQAKKELDGAADAWTRRNAAQRQAKIDRALTKAKFLSVEVSSKEAQLLASGTNQAGHRHPAETFKVVPPVGVEKWVNKGQEMWSDELSDLRVWTVQKCL